MLLRCFAFVLPFFEYCSLLWESAAECHPQLLQRQVYSVASLWPDQSFLSLCHWHNVAGLSMLFKVNSYSNHCLFIELPSFSTRVWHTRAVAAAHPLEFEVSMCKTSQFAGCILPTQVRMWNVSPHSGLHWNAGWVLCVIKFSLAQVLVGLWKQFIYKQLCFSHLALSC